MVAQVHLEKAHQATSYEAALAAAADALTEQLAEAMKASGIKNAAASIESLKKSGLDKLLARCVARGRVGYGMVNAELDRLRAALVQRTLTAVEVKLGILAFDEAAQRLALVAGKNGSFQYAGEQNHARDSLITFARSLHR